MKIPGAPEPRRTSSIELDACDFGGYRGLNTDMSTSFSLKVVVGATGTRGKTMLDSCRVNRERLPWQVSMAIFDLYQFQDWRFLYHVFGDIG